MGYLGCFHHLANYTYFRGDSGLPHGVFCSCQHQCPAAALKAAIRAWGLFVQHAWTGGWALGGGGRGRSHGGQVSSAVRHSALKRSSVRKPSSFANGNYHVGFKGHAREGAEPGVTQPAPRGRVVPIKINRSLRKSKSYTKEGLQVVGVSRMHRPPAKHGAPGRHPSCGGYGRRAQSCRDSQRLLAHVLMAFPVLGSSSVHWPLPPQAIQQIRHCCFFGRKMRSD